VKISTIVPAYNEAAAIEAVVEEYLSYSDEIILIDDGSTDETASLIDSLADTYATVTAVHHDENRGKANALRTGVEHATGDVVVFTDADETYPAEYVPALVAKVKQGADIALGSRLAAGGTNIPRINRLGNRLLSFIVSFIGGVRLTDTQTGMRAMRRDRFAQLDAADATNLEFETMMTVRAAKMGYNIEEVPIKYRERTGESKLRPARDGYGMFSAVAKILFSESSLVMRSAIIFSLCFSMAGMYTGGVSILNTIRTGLVQHQFYPLLTVFFFFTAFYTFTLVLMSEQIMHRIDRIEEQINKRK
jgi:glycosyltransferase involved in cell wall biosynthesis